MVEEAQPVETSVTAQASGPGKIRQRSSRVAAGVTLIKRVHSRGPKRVFALVVNPRRRPFDVALAGGRLRGFARTRSMAKAHRALAAVNGDFALPSGSPVHAFAEDGNLKRSTLAQGRNFAVRRDQRQAYAGTPRVDVLLGEDTGGRFRVTRWNDGTPVVGEIAGYSGAGAGVARPPPGACIARLRVKGRPRWYGDQRGLERTYEVRKAGCFADRVSRGTGNILLAARSGTSEGAVLASLAVDGDVTLRWSLGWKAVLDSVGGTPLLLKDGNVVAESCKADICRRHPRTAVGFTSRGKIILMVVDGRRRKWSVGMTLVELAREMRRLGARGAINLDGGGSSTMVVKGRIRNRPSDGSERAVSSAVLVLRERDRGDPSPAEAEVVPAGEAEEAGSAAALDPASTGGLLDALERGALGGKPFRLPAEFRKILEGYRKANR